MAIGPLTNIALLLTQYPECRFNIRRLVIMGGSAGRGNFTPNAEFNIAIDPEAAALRCSTAGWISSCAGWTSPIRRCWRRITSPRLPTLNQTGENAARAV